MHDSMGTRELLAWLGSLGIFALVGRLAYHLYLVRKAKRKCFGWDLVFDGPIVVLAVGAAGAVHEIFDLGPWATHAIAGFGAYLGPQGLYALLEAWVTRQKGNRK